MKKIGIYLFILCCITTNARSVRADAFLWYFGDNPSSDYEITINGPVDDVFIPANFKASETLPPGFIIGAGMWAKKDGIPYGPGTDWIMNWYEQVPNYNAGFNANELYHFLPYRINGMDWINNAINNPVPEGVYESLQEYCTLNYWLIEDVEGKSVNPLNKFKITVTNQASPVPEPATMILFGTGLAGLAATPRRKKTC